VHPFREVLLEQCHAERLLVGEVLIQGADGDTGPHRYPVRGAGRVALVLKNLSSRAQDVLDGGPRPSLDGLFSRLEADRPR
jgi:hypothetical protein